MLICFDVFVYCVCVCVHVGVFAHTFTQKMNINFHYNRVCTNMREINIIQITYHLIKLINVFICFNL